MTAELRRNLVLAAVGLLGGFGLIVALFGSAELMKRPFAPAEQGGLPASADGQPAGGQGAESKAGENKSADGKSADEKAAADVGKPDAGARPNSGVSGSQAEKPLTPGASANGGAGSQGEADAKQDASKSANTPSFDLVRVEPTGETVVAGRGAPNTAIEMLVNGKPVARALADPNGQFALVPPALPPGDSEIALRIVDPQGRETRSAQSVAVVVAPDRKTRPLVALSAPGRPTVVLSQPDAVAANEPRPDASPADRAPGAAGSSAAGTGTGDAKAAQAKPAEAKPGASKPADAKVAAGVPSGADARSPKTAADAARPAVPGKPEPAKTPPAKTPSALKIVSVDAQEGGRLYVTGQAVPGATVRLYLNDTLVAPASVGPDGKVVFTIGKGVAAGEYRVRIDQVDSVTGAVRTRAEVPFVFPEAAARVASREPAWEAARAPSRPDEGKAVAALPPPGVKPEPGPHAAERSASAPHAASAPKAVPAQKSAAAPESAPTPAPSVAQAAPGSAAASRETPKASEQAAAAPTSPPAAPADALAVASGSTEAPAAGSAGSAFVAEIATAKITRGDNLWQISRKVYGSGLRYTVIYDANQDQIRDPDKIFPGQIFVLPKDSAKDAPKEGKAGRG